MSRTRLSTTVDDDLLQAARRVRSGNTDAAMIDEALRALVARHRSAEVEASYTAYDEHPLDEPDECGGRLRGLTLSQRREPTGNIAGP